MDSLLSPRRKKPSVPPPQRRRPPVKKVAVPGTTAIKKPLNTTQNTKPVAIKTPKPTLVKQVPLVKPVLLVKQVSTTPEPSKELLLALGILEVIKTSISKLNDEKDVDKVNMFKVYEKTMGNIVEAIKIDGNNIKEKKNEIKDCLKTYHTKFGNLESSNKVVVGKEHNIMKFIKHKSKDDPIVSQEVTIQRQESIPDVDIGEIHQRLTRVIDNFRSSLSTSQHQENTTVDEDEAPKKERRASKSFTEKFNLLKLSKLTHPEPKEEKIENQTQKSACVDHRAQETQAGLSTDDITVDTSESIQETQPKQCEEHQKAKAEEEEIRVQQELEYYKTLGGKLSTLIGDFKESYIKSLHQDKNPTGTTKKPSSDIKKLTDIKTNLLQITTSTEEQLKYKKLSKLYKDCKSKFDKIPLNEQTAYLRLEIEQLLEEARTKVEIHKSGFHVYASSVDTNSSSSRRTSVSTPDLATACSMDNLSEDPEEVKKNLCRLKSELESIVKKIESSNILNDGLFLKNLNQYQEQLGDMPSVLSPDIVDTRRQVFDLLMQAYDLLDEKH